MKRGDAFKSKYLGKGDLDHPVIAIIEEVIIEKIKSDDGDEQKAICYFRNGIKPMVINVGNWSTIESAYGEESDNWRGKRVELYVDPNVMFGREKVGGVRVRIPAGHGGNGDVWSFDQAVQACVNAGITQPQFIAKLKEHGLKGYNAVRDTAFVRALIDTADGQEQPLEPEVPIDDVPI